VANSYAARVKGTYGTMPRGYPWVILVHYAAIGALFATFMVHGWYGTVGGIVIFVGGAVAVRALRNLKTAAFRAHPEGIRLGGGRHCVQVPWQEIQEIRISPATDGALADIVLLPSAPAAPARFPPTAEVLLSLVPGLNLFLKPPLLAPLTGPVRYCAPLWGTTADEVAERLRPLAPDSVPIVH
jgi:hypothetical protein